MRRRICGVTQLVEAPQYVLLLRLDCYPSLGVRDSAYTGVLSSNEYWYGSSSMRYVCKRWFEIPRVDFFLYARSARLGSHQASLPLWNISIRRQNAVHCPCSVLVHESTPVLELSNYRRHVLIFATRFLFVLVYSTSTTRYSTQDRQTPFSPVPSPESRICFWYSGRL